MRVKNIITPIINSITQDVIDVGFLPTDLLGNVLWLDALDDSTITDISGLEVWSDKSGLGNNNTQVTVGFRPAYVINAFNDLPAVRFDGVDDYLEKLNISLVAGDSLSAFIVSRRIDNISNNLGNVALWETGQDSDFNNIESISFNNATTNAMEVLRDLMRNTTPHPANGIPFLLSTIFNGTSNNSFLNKDDASFTNPFPSTGDFNIQNIRIGARQAFGSVGFFWNGDIAELIIYDRALSTFEQQTVEDYLVNKWKLILTFPITFTSDFSSDFS